MVPAAGRVRDRTPDEWLSQLDRELSYLPEKYRAPIVLCELEGMTHRQAAEQLGWPVGTLSGRLSRARALLARRLSRRGLTLSVSSLAAMFAHDAASAGVPASLFTSTIRAVPRCAAGPASAAGLVSPTVAALAEGVIRMMILSHLRLVVISVVLALGLCGIAGAMVQLGRDGAGPGRIATAVPVAQRKEAAGQVKGSPTTDEETALTKARTVVAKKGYEFAMGTLEETGRGRLAPVSFARPEDVYRWSVRWLQVEREMNPRPTDHRAALEAHLKRMTELDKLVERLVKEHLSDRAKLDAEWYVLEARLWLEQAKAK